MSTKTWSNKPFPLRRICIIGTDNQNEQNQTKGALSNSLLIVLKIFYSKLKFQNSFKFNNINSILLN